MRILRLISQVVEVTSRWVSINKDMQAGLEAGGLQMRGHSNNIIHNHKRFAIKFYLYHSKSVKELYSESA